MVRRCISYSVLIKKTKAKAKPHDEHEETLDSDGCAWCLGHGAGIGRLHTLNVGGFGGCFFFFVFFCVNYNSIELKNKNKRMLSNLKREMGKTLCQCYSQHQYFLFWKI